MPPTALDLTGNGSANNLYGNNGANVLNGGGGNDVMLGLRRGRHVRVHHRARCGQCRLSIADFAPGTDKIALDDAIFAGIGGPGALEASAFVAGTAAADASDRIVYDMRHRPACSTTPTATAPARRSTSPR